MNEMELQVNPAGSGPAYLQCLNTCFPGWGDERTYDWVFTRRLEGEPQADRLVLSQDGELLAGSGISYRGVRLPTGAEVRAGIMTGSWTLPAARGRGCFHRLIEKSLRVTAERGGALLLAFVSAENPSRRQLERAGAALFPTSYLVLGAQEKNNNRTAVRLTREGSWADGLFKKWEKRWDAGTRFVYRSATDWRAQFANRPWTTALARAGTKALAVVEEHTDTDRINALLSADAQSDCEKLTELADSTPQAGRKLFFFSTEPRLTALAKGIGFEEKPGFLTAMVADARLLDEALHIRVDGGSAVNQSISDPGSPRFLGPWNLQAGDRV